MLHTEQGIEMQPTPFRFDDYDGGDEELDGGIALGGEKEYKESAHNHNHAVSDALGSLPSYRFRDDARRESGAHALPGAPSRGNNNYHHSNNKRMSHGCFAFEEEDEVKMEEKEEEGEHPELRVDRHWTCSVCTFDNSAGASECGACG